ncbi:MAG: hypothetical protein R3343_08685 [Nitriliruptorales bacterium]|nr:hypothetical protein [Nitriliruptorales bacterium]
MLLAHGVGVRGDLPLPLWIVSYGAAAVLVITFVGLVRGWKEPRLEDGGVGRPLPGWVQGAATPVEWLLRIVGVAALAVVVVAGLTGPETGGSNFAPFMLYVIVWAGGMFVSGFVGNVWSALDPVETVRKGLPVDEDAPDVRARLGLWPAAVLLLLFTWLELAYFEPADPFAVTLMVVVLIAAPVLGGLWSSSWWLRGANAFGALFRLLATMAPFHRDDEGVLRVRAPLSGLPRLNPIPGTVALILVALGSTTFDGFTRTTIWESVAAGKTGWTGTAIATLGLLVITGIVAAMYLGAMADAAKGTEHSTGDLARAFAHTLIPIALGYAVAHYFSLLVFEGQQAIKLASDPFDLGWDLFGTADWTRSFSAVSAATIAWVQAGAIVLGHVAAVVLAHDRAIALFPQRKATESQIALMIVMVVYTMGGLGLLLGA